MKNTIFNPKSTEKLVALMDKGYHQIQINTQIMKKLLKKDIDPNVKDSKGNTPLHVASYIGAFDCAKILLELGADPNSKGKHGLTPLTLACMNNAYYSAKLLLENGADVTIENSDGSTAFNFVQSQEMKDLLTAEVLRLKKENQDLLKRIQDLQARGIM